MKIIGITGKSGSGKSIFATLLSKKLNCSCINIDFLGHEATNRPEMLDSFISKFGDGILNNNNTINRKKLGDIVFSSKEKMRILEDLTWQYMQQRLDNILSNKCDYIVLEWALLPLSKYWDMCDFKVLTRADDVKRRNKVMKRDNISDEYFKKRDVNSQDYSKYSFDYIYECNYNDEDLLKTIDQVYNIIRRI